MIGRTNAISADKSKGLTATAADILLGKTALVNGQVVTGTMGSLLGDMAIGSIVKADVGGTTREFIVVQQGRPSSIYSTTFNNATVLLMKDAYENRQWHTSNVNNYAASAIHSYLNNTFLNLCSTVIRNNVKQVKIPYRAGEGYGTTVTSGESGLAAKIWLPSGYEVGITTPDNLYFPADGSKFSYFLSGAAADANTRRLCYLNGIAVDWWLRSPFCNTNNGSANAWSVNSKGNTNYAYHECSYYYGIRPALALPNSMLVLPDGTLA